MVFISSQTGRLAGRDIHKQPQTLQARPEAGLTHTLSFEVELAALRPVAARPAPQGMGGKRTFQVIRSARSAWVEFSQRENSHLFVGMRQPCGMTLHSLR